MNELPDTADGLEAKATASKVPLGFWVLFWGLILWGVYYTWTYTPSLGGWSQSKAYEESVQGAVASTGEAGSNIFMTVLFTALPTLAAIGLYLAARKRKAR
jgi:LPXTG-motif cell wall-anchored protein